MRYIFKILILGDPDAIQFYALRAFEEPGEEKGTYFEWYKEVRVLEDVCDLEIDVVTSVSADLDELLPIVDGIIYFLNPQVEGESELFEMILPDIFSIKRPTIVIFYDQNGILPISVNDLLENVWVNYHSLEAFVNLPPKDFHQALQSLSLAMINGDTPLNIENAWMRFPIFIQMANIYFDNKNYYYAAQAVKKIAMIAEIYNKEEFFIFSEQAAYLYSLLNLNLEASKILEKVDKIKSINYKNLHADTMIREGNFFFNRKDYEKAARQYERTAQWSSIESLETNLIRDAFKLAINSWISACNVEKAFRILDSLRHTDVLSILKEVSDKIAAAADFLIDNGNFESAGTLMLNAVDRYQQEALSEELKILSIKLTDIKIQFFNQLIDERDIYTAKNTYDEIENIWGARSVKKTNLDSPLEKLITILLEEKDFGMASVLINKLNSRESRQNLAKIKDEFEDSFTELKKKETVDYINSGIDIIREYSEAERDLIIEMNKLKINEAEELTKGNEFVKAATHLKIQADYLKMVGKEEISNQILTKSLDILLEGTNFEEFFKIFNILASEMKTKYLSRIFPKYIQKLKEIKKIDDYKRKKSVLENSNKIFRNQMFYEESKEISLIFVEIIKEEILVILENEENTIGISKAEALIKKVSNLSEAYLENSRIKFDNIFKNIAEIYINLDDLPSANSYTDRIENRGLRDEIHKRIEKLEAERSAEVSKRAKDTFKGEVLKERLSLIQTRGREALLDYEKELKKRKALKRIYFKEALSHIKQHEYEEAINLYKKSINPLNKRQDYNLAGVSLAITSLLFIKIDRINEIRKIFTKTIKGLSGLGRLFKEAFPVLLIEYIIDLNRFQANLKIKEALSNFKNLPLFEEEEIVLYELLGEDYQREKISNGTTEIKRDIKEIMRKINDIASKIQREKQDITKRKMMKNQYWKQVLEDISENKLKDASMAYLDTLPLLTEKNLLKPAAISLIIGIVILYKENDLEIARDAFNTHLKEYGSVLKKLPELQLMKFLLEALENNETALINRIGVLFLEKLILFEPEIKIIKTLIQETEESEKSDDLEGLTREQLGNISKLKVEFGQIFGKIQSKMVDIVRESDRLLKKRNAFRKRYYNDILDLLKSKNFKEIPVKYYNLSITISKRKDFETSSLLILLYGLVLLKINEPIKTVKKKINDYLNGLGINKKLVKDNFYVMLILFLLDVKLNNFDKYIIKTKEILGVLPLFEEEKVLVELGE